MTMICFTKVNPSKFILYLKKLPQKMAHFVLMYVEVTAGDSYSKVVMKSNKKICVFKETMRFNFIGFLEGSALENVFKRLCFL